MKFPTTDGWSIFRQFPLPGGQRIDFLIYRKRLPVLEAIVVKCKDGEMLDAMDIEQVVGHMKRCRARKGIIYIANNTEVPGPVKLTVLTSGVELRRTWWRAELRGDDRTEDQRVSGQ